MNNERESIRVLEECIDLQKRKSRDYQNDKSNVKQAMHYRRGVSTIHDMVAQKLLRAQSLLEAYENGDTSEPNFEGLEDTYKDAINYLSFAVSFIRGNMEGQDSSRDMLNRKKEKITDYTPFEGGTLKAGSIISGGPISFDPGILSNDTSGGSSCGVADVEDDGWSTVYPILPVESKIKRDYFQKVLPVGKIELPEGEVNVTDDVQIKYVKEVNPNHILRGSIRDIGDRIEGDYDEHVKKVSER